MAQPWLQGLSSESWHQEGSQHGDAPDASPTKAEGSASGSSCASVLLGQKQGSNPTWKRLALQDHSNQKSFFEPSELEKLFQTSESPPSNVGKKSHASARSTTSNFLPHDAPTKAPSITTTEAEEFSAVPIYKQYTKDGQVLWSVFDADRSVEPGDSVSQCVDEENRGAAKSLPTDKSLSPEEEPPSEPDVINQSGSVRIRRPQAAVASAPVSLSGARRLSHRTMTPIYQSVTTRDYVHEAMAVLNALRAGSSPQTLGLVSPEKVAHLISQQQAGMKFDTANQTWMAPSDTNSDPLAEIPNLSSSSHVQQPSYSPSFSSSEILSEVNNQPMQELSFAESFSDGRVRSVTLRLGSACTPARTSIRNSRAVKYRTPKSSQSNSFMQTLSPLTEFTIHGQDDKKHYKTGQWCPPDERLSNDKGSIGTSRTVSSLVESLYERCPDVPWESMKHLDLSCRNLESVHVLHEVTPAVIELDLRSNMLNQVQGIPASVRHLDISTNRLSSLTTWTSLTNLQYLDVSDNDLDSLTGFECLIHLRQLRAKNNRIEDLTPLQDLDLQVVDVSHNYLRSIDFTNFAWPNMEILDVSNNEIEEIKGLEYLDALDELELGYNRLTTLVSTSPDESPNANSSLRILCTSGNQLTELDLAAWPGLETCTADGNKLVDLQGVRDHKRLHTLSLQDMQPSDKPNCNFNLEDLCDISHLSLAGTALSETFDIREPWLNLRTLEIPRTGIRYLPRDFGRLAPNIRNLDLCNNALKDISPLKGILRMKKLLLVGNCIERQRKTISALIGMAELEEVDLSDNPLTTGFYAAEEERLDEGVAMRKRLYEMLLASKCKALRFVDGAELDRQAIRTQDEIWEKLLGFGYVMPKPARVARHETRSFAHMT